MRFYTQIMCTVLMLVPALAQADGYYGGRGGGFGGGGRSRFRVARDFENRDSYYTPAVGGSVASPSDQAIFGENPVGLLYNQELRLVGTLGTVRDYSTNLGTGLSLYTGNGLAAGSIGIITVPNTTDGNGSITLFPFGIATFAEGLNLAFGINGIYRFAGNVHTTTLTPGAGDVPTWTSNFGVLYNPYGRLHIGATVYELSKGVTGYGLGASTYLNPNSVFALDVGMNNHGRGTTVKPGISVLADSLSLSYAYGMRADKSAESDIPAGNTIGIGYEFNSQFKLQGYFNLVTPWYLGATISF